ncbi:MAG: YdcF family protein [Alphaproteobacteria bacterium]|nr:MAG: YdcF family protein [Alphaproteobacteria bacterium]
MPGRPWRRWLAGAALVLLGLWLGGFLLFVARLERHAPARVRADAGVVLTGGPGRIEAAIALLRGGQVGRVLISGVHPAVTPEELARAAGIDAELATCCVDLDFGALDTRGNARAAARWAAMHGFASLVVVTADNHMPRALYLFHQAMPGRVLIAYPVAAHAGLWGLLREYSKHLWTLLTPAPAAANAGRDA